MDDMQILISYKCFFLDLTVKKPDCVRFCPYEVQAVIFDEKTVGFEFEFELAIYQHCHPFRCFLTLSQIYSLRFMLLS